MNIFSSIKKAAQKVVEIISKPKTPKTKPSNPKFNFKEFFRSAKDAIIKPKLKNKSEKSLKKRMDVIFPETKIEHKRDDGPLIYRINETMSFIQHNSELNRDDQLSLKLNLVMDRLINDRGHKYSPGEENDYFKILDTWDGKTSSLISNVTFKDVGTDPKIAAYLEDIITSKWGSEERHDKYLQEAHQKAFKTLTDKYDMDLSKSMLTTLERLMNSSEMWHIVGDRYGLGTKQYDSNQAEQLMMGLLVKMQNTITTSKNNLGNSDLQTLVQMVSNTEDYESIMDFLDDRIKYYKQFT